MTLWNLQVARELLEQVGIDVVPATNGLEAVKLATKERFDGILMDLQMPVMDGLTATREIRRGPSAPELPIMAMTANAMAAARDECLAAGMNDHIAKPIKPAILYEILARRIRTDVDVCDYLDQETTIEPVSIELAGEIPDLDGINIKSGMGAVNGNWKLYAKLLQNFRERHRDIAKEIQTELKCGNLKVAQRMAHTVKGVAGTLGANRLSAVSAQLESAFKTEDSKRIWNRLDRFSKEVTRVIVALDDYIEKENGLQSEELSSAEKIQTQSNKGMVQPQLKKLCEALSDRIDAHDAEALTLVAEIKTLWGRSNFGEHFLKLESLLNEFKFEKAKDLIEKVTKELGMKSFK